MENRLGNPLILVTDMQNVYKKGQVWGCEHFDNVCANIQKLLNNISGQEIIFTKYIASAHPIGTWKDYNRKNKHINEDRMLNEIVDELKGSAKQYKCYKKCKYSSLSISEIKEVVKNKTCVVISGVVAECCILSTVLELIDEGVYVVYLTDAVAGIDMESEQATQRVLNGFAPLQMQFMTTDEYICKQLL